MSLSNKGGIQRMPPTELQFITFEPEKRPEILRSPGSKILDL